MVPSPPLQSTSGECSLLSLGNKRLPGGPFPAPLHSYPSLCCFWGMIAQRGWESTPPKGRGDAEKPGAAAYFQGFIYFLAFN